MARAQRLILTSQYKIMAMPEPGKAGRARRYQSLIKYGSASEMRALDKASGELSQTLCRTVIDMLEMHYALHVFGVNLKEHPQLDERDSPFRALMPLRKLTCQATYAL